MHEDINKNFTHLKIHTQYSICEGALRTADLAKFCKTNKIDKTQKEKDFKNIYSQNPKYIKGFESFFRKLIWLVK